MRGAGVMRRSAATPGVRRAGVLAVCLIGLGLAPAAPAAERTLPDFTRLVDTYGAAVVNISTNQRAASAPGPDAPDAPGETPFGELSRPHEGAPDSLDNASLGSGFVISADGYVLTCAHVVEGASEILVRLTDRREFRARLVGADARSDVALLRIDASGLPTVAIGEPRRLKVGEWVLAIGAPFGFDNSATGGIVSAKGRSLPSENYIPFIQTDVAINPGNSGGPLFNLRGEVVGVNSQIYSRTGGFMGVSFAIPIDLAMRIAEQLKTEGRVRRGWLGVSLQEVTRGLAAAYGMTQPRGALIADMLPNGPAAKSELRTGDIVLEYEGRAIDRSSDLPPLVGQAQPGTRARLTVLRRGQGTQAAHAIVGELKEEATKTAAQPPRREEGRRPGIVLSELTAPQRRRQDLDYGARVEAVDEGPARSAGLRPGDVILEVDGKRIGNTADFERLLAHAPKGRPALLRIRRGAQTLYLALDPPG